MIDWDSYSFKDIIVKKSNSVLSLTLDRVKSKNAFSDDMIEGLCLAFNLSKKDHEIKLITLTGNGNVFCAGGDIKLMKTNSGMFSGNSFELKNNYQEGIQKIPKAFSELEIPIIALVNGPAIGAGFDLACMCDLRFCCEEAYFCESFASIGLIPGDGGAFFLERVLGYPLMMELILTGRKVKATEAKEKNLVTQVYPCKDFYKLVERDWFKKILDQDSMALRLTKKLINNRYEGLIREHLNYASALQSITQRHSKTHQEFKKK